MKLEVWGLGHAGLVCAAGCARDGHRVLGVDIDAARVARLNAGETYLREPGLPECVASAVAGGQLAGATPAALDPVLPDAVLLCLPTPAAPDGTLDTAALLAAAAPLAVRLRASTHFPVLVVRSTVPVHFTRGTLRPLLEALSGKQAGRGFGLAMAPEFLREGSALADFAQPSLIVLGADDAASREAAAPLCAHARCATRHVSTAVAELFKLTNNAFHALKIGFANEVARLAHAHATDGHEVMRLLCEDTRFNLSAAYLAPGFAFGGACLDKDLGALQALGEASCAPLLEAISASNRAHLDACVAAIRARPWRRLGLYGITNKAGSDDLRHSPVLALIDALQLPPGTLWVCDPDLRADQAPLLAQRYGAEIAASLAELRERVDLVVNFRAQPLPAAPGAAELHFGRSWDGKGDDAANATP